MRPLLLNLMRMGRLVSRPYDATTLRREVSPTYVRPGHKWSGGLEQGFEPCSQVATRLETIQQG